MIDRENREALGFESALMYIKNGGAVMTRAAWPDDLVVTLEKYNDVEIQTVVNAEGDEVDVEVEVEKKRVVTGDLFGAKAGYTPSMDDLMANDWFMIPEKEIKAIGETE